MEKIFITEVEYADVIQGKAEKIHDLVIKLSSKHEIWKIFKNPFNGKDTKYLVSTRGRIFDSITNEIREPRIVDKVSKYNRHRERYIYDTKPRTKITLNDKTSDLHVDYPVARIVLLTFEPIENFKDMEVDHIDGNPLNNNYYNLEWVTHYENMRRAKEKYMNNFERKKGQIGGFCPCYDDDFIHKICQAICDELSRKDIREKFNINGQLIDDIKSGRSHKDISSQYLDKGFKYKIITEKHRKERRKKITKICELIDKGFTNTEIRLLLNLPNNEINLPNDIRKLRIYRYISKDYNFGKDITQTYFRERI